MYTPIHVYIYIYIYMYVSMGPMHIYVGCGCFCICMGWLLYPCTPPPLAKVLWEILNPRYDLILK